MIIMTIFLEVIREIEKKWQKKWQEDNVFVGVIDKNKPKWFLTVSYPYATAPLHIGHSRTYGLGDIFARYKRQQGYNSQQEIQNTTNSLNGNTSS